MAFVGISYLLSESNCGVASTTLVWIQRKHQMWSSCHFIETGKKKKEGKQRQYALQQAVLSRWSSGSWRVPSMSFLGSPNFLAYCFIKCNMSLISLFLGISWSDIRLFSSCCSLSSDECFSLTVQESKGIAPYQALISDKAPSKERRQALSRILQSSTDQCWTAV